MLNYIMYSMGTLGFDFRIVPSGFRRTFLHRNWWSRNVYDKQIACSR